LTGGIYVNRKAVSHCPARNARDKGSYLVCVANANDSVIASGTPVANVNIVGTGVGEISTGRVTESDVLNAFKNILKCVPTDGCIAATIIIAESAISVSCIVGSVVEATGLKRQKAGAGVLVAAAITIERTCTSCGVGLTIGVVLEGPGTERRVAGAIRQAKEGVRSRGCVLPRIRSSRWWIHRLRD
jgi:hypothetical protein